MNLLQLQYFYVVAKEGGFTRAAQALRVRQPAISRMVSQLESQLGFLVFERQGRGVRLTARGERLYAHAQRIFDEVDELRGSLEEIAGECSGELRFAASEPIASSLVPRALRSLLVRYPGVYPRFTSGPASFLLDKVRSSTAEFGLFFHVPELREGLAVIERLPARFHLVVAASHRDNAATLASFIGSREVDDTTTRQFPTLEAWRRTCPEAKIRISTNNLSAHRALVLAGLGISVLPAALVGASLRSGRLLDLMPERDLVFDLLVVARETSVLSRGAREFLAALRERVAARSTRSKAGAIDAAPVRAPSRTPPRPTRTRRSA